MIKHFDTLTELSNILSPCHKVGYHEPFQNVFTQGLSQNLEVRKEETINSYINSLGKKKTVGIYNIYI